MSGFTCPYCNATMALSYSTKQIRYTSFESPNGYHNVNGDYVYYNSALAITFYKCPNCEQYTIISEGIGDSVRGTNNIIRPLSLAKQFPEYIPLQIRSDYEEACAILHLSPKASASLSRRCLQGMIRDYWRITKGRLYDEITELKDRVQPDLWQALDGLRQLGNIGAHMEKDTNLIVDIDPNEAEKLVSLIELLMKEWYINREERTKLFGDILQINADKQSQRKGEE